MNSPLQRFDVGVVPADGEAMFSHDQGDHVEVLHAPFDSIDERRPFFPGRSSVFANGRDASNDVLVQQVHVVVDLFDPHFETIQPVLDSVQSFLDSVQTPLDFIQPRLDSIQSQLDLVQPLLDSIETHIDPIRPLLERAKTLVDSIKPFLGHASFRPRDDAHPPARLLPGVGEDDDDTSSTRLEEEQSSCRSEFRGIWSGTVGGLQRLRYVLMSNPAETATY